CVNRAWKTSMEVGVRVITEDLLSTEQRYCCHAYLTFVALPQPPIATLVPGSSLPTLSKPPSSGTDSKETQAALANSPAARRYSFSLPTSSSSNHHHSTTTSSRPTETKTIQLPAIEPITPVELERYTMAQIRREARLQQSREGKEAEEKMLSDIRDQMRRWNVGEIHKRVANGGPLMTMQSTFAESAQLVLPQHANSLSITFGGQVMKWMENVCAVSATRFARLPVVTASIDSLQFHRKTMIGDCLTMRSMVTRVFKSSMEVYVFVDSENLVTGKQTFTNEGFFSMVTLQPSSTSSPKISTSHLPELRPESDLQQALSDSGEHRRVRRLKQRRELAEREAAHTTTAHIQHHDIPQEYR
ncbi:Acyl-coenzyme A thioesterase 11, partial [Podila humilis]